MLKLDFWLIRFPMDIPTAAMFSTKTVEAKKMPRKPTQAKKMPSKPTPANVLEDKTIQESRRWSKQPCAIATVHQDE